MRRARPGREKVDGVCVTLACLDTSLFTPAFTPEMRIRPVKLPSDGRGGGFAQTPILTSQANQLGLQGVGEAPVQAPRLRNSRETLAEPRLLCRGGRVAGQRLPTSRFGQVSMPTYVTEHVAGRCSSRYSSSAHSGNNGVHIQTVPSLLRRCCLFQWPGPREKRV